MLRYKITSESRCIMDKKSILDKLSQIDKNKYGIFEIGLFGSYAKDNADYRYISKIRV